MADGKDYDKQEVINNIEVGQYIRWKPPVSMRIRSDYHQYGFNSFIGSGSSWEYGLVIDLLESPRSKENPTISICSKYSKLKTQSICPPFNICK